MSFENKLKNLSYNLTFKGLLHQDLNVLPNPPNQVIIDLILGTIMYAMTPAAEAAKNRIPALGNMTVF